MPLSAVKCPASGVPFDDGIIATKRSGRRNTTMLSSLESGRELFEAGAITSVEFQALKHKLLKQAKVQPALAAAA